MKKNRNFTAQDLQAQILKLLYNAGFASANPEYWEIEEE
jgi:hypothetical protein